MMSVFYQITNQPKWHDKRLSELRNKRNREYKKLCSRRSRSSNTNDDSFIKALNEYESHRRQLFNDFIRKKAHDVKHNPKSFWQYINDKLKSSTLPMKMKFDNDIAIDR